MTPSGRSSSSRSAGWLLLLLLPTLLAQLDDPYASIPQAAGTSRRAKAGTIRPRRCVCVCVCVCV